jgi:transglutaminase-like putative cysteine protease
MRTPKVLPTINNHSSINSLVHWIFSILTIFYVFIYPSLIFAAPRYEVKPQPSWVKDAQYSQETPQASTSSTTGALKLLRDNQLRVVNKSTERYFRDVIKITSPTGLEDFSEIKFEFDPSYEQLVIHYIQIRRGDATINALNQEEIKVIQQESELNERLYNGRLSALVFLKDVRVGDIIDYAFSINGDNPVLGGRFAHNLFLSGTYPVQALRYRLLWPSNRTLHYKSLNNDKDPLITNNGEEIEYLWEQQDVSPPDYEDGTPSWFSPYPMVQLSEFSSWEEVVNWSIPLFNKDGALSPALLKQIDSWEREFKEPEARLLTALRFVQDEVRYLGIESGPYSHQPTGPSKVFERRFGDCKDKSLLLSTLLNRMGIEAYPALVNTDALHLLDKWQPTPYAFDHVIVEVKLNGKSYWFDPTITMQRGRLDQHHNPEYYRALILRSGEKQLTEIPVTEMDSASTATKETYTLVDYESPASLKVITTYHHKDADAFRYKLSRQSLTELGKVYLNYYAGSYPDISADGLPVVVDDPKENIVTVTETYKIPTFWNNGARWLNASLIDQNLYRPQISQRSMPLGISYPLYVSQTIEVYLPHTLLVPTDSDTISDNNISLNYKYEFKGKVLTLNYKLRTLRDHVPADQVSSYLKTVDKIESALGYTVWSGTTQWGKFDWTGVVIVIAVLLAPVIIFGSIAGIRSLTKGQRRREFKSKLKTLSGENPSDAIRVKTEDEMKRYLANYKCSCGTPYYSYNDPLQTEGVIYNEERLTVVRLRCNSCSNIQDLYFVQPYQETGVVQ